MRKLLLLLALGPCLAHASKSLSLGSTTATYSVPNLPQFPSNGSYWVDLRFHDYTIPAGACNNLVQVPGAQIRLCDPAISGGGIIAGFPNVHNSGGVPNLVNPPGIPIISLAKSNPAVLNFASPTFQRVMPPGSTVTVWGNSDSSCAGLNGNHTVLSASAFSLTLDYDATGCSYSSGARVFGPDILFRLQVNVTAGQVSGETWNVDGTGYSAVVQPFDALNAYTLPQSGLQIGSASASLSYVRWCSGTLPLNSVPPTSSLTTPCSGGTVLADWEFESSLADSGPNRLSLNVSPRASYGDSPSYAPACSPGVQQTFRSQTAASLDGSRSFPLDGGSALSFEWQSVASTEPGAGQIVHWTSPPTSPTPAFDGFIAGPLNFQLTVTDGSNQSTTCMIHDGAVATDDNGNISFADPHVGQLLGPLTQWGRSDAPWPWLDTIEKEWADKLGGYQGFFIPGGIVTDFNDTWNTPAPGTVDCVNGQTTCTGHGTSFQELFCGGAGQTAGLPSLHFIGWYNYTVSGGGGGTGRRFLNVASCPSETSVVLSSPWSPPTQSGMNFAVWTDSGLGSWLNQSANINYYDNVLAFYSMYYRTGIDSYLHYARWLADRWWTMPFIDRGNGNDCVTNSSQCGNLTTAPRLFSMTGMFMRAIDQDDTAGAPNSSPMWAGLREAINNVFRSPLIENSLIGDLRETSYSDMFVALCAVYDPDPVNAANCRADVARLLTNRWQPARRSDGHWQAFTGTWSNLFFIYPNVNTLDGGATVSVQQGSPNVTLANSSTWDNSSVLPPGTIFFSVGNFNDPSTFDTHRYAITYVDPHHATISPPYAENCASPGNTCTGRSWVVQASLGWIGFGTQPFMLGISGQWFNQAYLALSLDPTYAPQAALAKSYVADAAKWISTAAVDGSGGTDPLTRGAFYGVGFELCTPGTDTLGCRCGPNNPNCGNVEASRENAGEAIATMALGYSYAPSPGLLTAVDSVFSANWAKFLPNPGSDGTYDASLEGFFLGTNNAKWFGFFWGMGRNADYLSTRQGGLLGPILVTVNLSVDIAKVPGAARFRVIPTDPSGKAYPAVLCSSSPCAVTINKVVGAWTFQISYLSAAGSVVSTGRPFPAYVK